MHFPESLPKIWKATDKSSINVWELAENLSVPSSMSKADNLTWNLCQRTKSGLQQSESAYRTFRHSFKDNSGNARRVIAIAVTNAEIHDSSTEVICKSVLYSASEPEGGIFIRKNGREPMLMQLPDLTTIYKSGLCFRGSFESLLCFVLSMYMLLPRNHGSCR